VCVFGEKCIRNESTGEEKNKKRKPLARSLVSIGFVGTFYLLLDIPVCVCVCRIGRRWWIFLYSAPLKKLATDDGWETSAAAATAGDLQIFVSLSV
jgi:hypothetical protein